MWLGAPACGLGAQLLPSPASARTLTFASARARRPAAKAKRTCNFLSLRLSSHVQTYSISAASRTGLTYSAASRTYPISADVSGALLRPLSPSCFQSVVLFCVPSRQPCRARCYIAAAVTLGLTLPLASLPQSGQSPRILRSFSRSLREAHH
eukprot:3070194-Pleurochrysis_carterae.AAC.2